MKNCGNHYTAHTIVPVDKRDNSCVGNDNSVLRKLEIIQLWELDTYFHKRKD